MKTLICLLASLFLASAATAQDGTAQDGTADPNARLAHFQKGVNLSHWYAQSMTGDYEEERLASYFTEADAKLIKSMGFDHVRLTVDESIPLTKTAGQLNEGRLGKFDERVQMLLDAGLNVIVDLHPSDEFKEALHEQKNLDKLAQDWAAWAKRLSKFDPDRVMLEIMNEPSSTWPVQEWMVAQETILNAMRLAAPEHTILVTPGGWSQADLITEMRPYRDRNVVYTIHWYEPHLFTHQAANWAGEACEGIAGLIWPVKPEQATEVTEQTTKAGSQSAKDLKWQIEQGWQTEQWAIDKLEAVVEWQRKHNVPVYVGEFGVYRKECPADTRYRWHEFFASEFQKRGWGWAIWDYAGGFSVLEDGSQPSGQRQPDKALQGFIGLEQEG